MSNGRHGREDDLLSRGFDAGNYANAYTSENLSKAWRFHNALTKDPAYRAAFVIGFFSSYETHEVPGVHRDELIEAERTYGQRMRDLGIAVDPRNPEDVG